MTLRYYNWSSKSKFKLKVFYNKGFLALFLGWVDLYVKLW